MVQNFMICQLKKYHILRKRVIYIIYKLVLMRGMTATVVSKCFDCYPRLTSCSPIGYPAHPMGSAR